MGFEQPPGGVEFPVLFPQFPQFSRCCTPAGCRTSNRQERQIVQSINELDGFLP
jgi:hypothetical protein